MVVVTAVAMKRAVDIENARARLEEQTASRMRLLNDLTRTVLNASPDLAALLRTVAAIAPDTLGADCGLAVLFDRSGQARRVARSDGAEPDLTPGALALALAAGVQGRPIILEDAPHDPRGRRPGGDAGAGDDGGLLSAGARRSAGRRAIRRQLPRRARLPPPRSACSAPSAGRSSLPVRLARLYDLEREKAAPGRRPRTVERDLLNTVSHELRTPLTAIKTSVSGLLARLPARTRPPRNACCKTSTAAPSG